MLVESPSDEPIAARKGPLPSVPRLPAAQR
jgi:hypothetical protein